VESIIHYVASKDRVLLLAYKEQASCAVRYDGMTAYTEGAIIRFTPILHSLGTSLGLNCHMSFQTNQACTCIWTRRGHF